MPYRPGLAARPVDFLAHGFDAHDMPTEWRPDGVSRHLADLQAQYLVAEGGNKTIGLAPAEMSALRARARILRHLFRYGFERFAGMNPVERRLCLRFRGTHDVADQIFVLVAGLWRRLWHGLLFRLMPGQAVELGIDRTRRRSAAGEQTQAEAQNEVFHVLSIRRVTTSRPAHRI